MQDLQDYETANPSYSALEQTHQKDSFAKDSLAKNHYLTLQAHVC
jgi:hypothetical protein